MKPVSREFQKPSGKGLAMRIKPIIVAALFGATTTAHAGLIGVSFGTFGDSAVYRIDEQTGSSELLFTSELNRINGVAGAPNGLIYATQEMAFGSGQSRLLVLDPAANTLDPVSPFMSLPDGSVRGLAFGNDTLYALVGNSGVNPRRTLYSIDVTTGAFSRIGGNQPSSIQGFAYSELEQTLYAWDVRFGLAVVDPFTGDISRVSNLGRPDAEIQALEFGLDGTLFGGRDELFSIDLLTGETTLIGSDGFGDVRGLAALSPTQVPTPPMTIMFLLAAILFVRRTAVSSLLRT